jgi:lipopolysaccharide transport system permease protein
MTEFREQADVAVVEPPRSAPRAPRTNARSSTVIKPSRGWVRLDLKGLWAYHELLFFLVWRDVKVRYKQTVVGILWVVVQPIMTMVVFTFIFGTIAKLPTSGIPYPIFAFSGLLPWQLFATGALAASTSVVSNSNMVTKVYFPRLIIPITGVVSGVVDFCVSLFVLVGLLLYYDIPWRWQLVTLPAFVVLAMATAFAVGLWFSVLNVRYRDVQYVIPYLLQIWLFVTPIAYAATLVPDRYRWLISLNPMTGVVNGFRWAIFGQATPFGAGFFVSIAVIVVLAAGGLMFFRRVEKSFADLI